MKNIYLGLSILGGIVPYIFFIDFFGSEGIALGSFVAALFENGAAGGFTADLLITSFVFWIFMWSRKTPRLWAYILINLTIGLSCALPAYLYVHAGGEENR